MLLSIRCADAARQRDEIGNGAEMNVRRVVPRMREAFGHRHPAEKGELRPNSPMAEIRHRNDSAAPDPQKMFEHDARLARGLQRLRQDHIVEGVGRIVDEIGVGVALNDGEPFGDTIVDALLRKLDSAPIDISLFDKQPQQLSIAAADVENARTGRDEFRYAQKVDARRSEVRLRLKQCPSLGRPRR